MIEYFFSLFKTDHRSKWAYSSIHLQYPFGNLSASSSSVTSLCNKNSIVFIASMLVVIAAASKLKAKLKGAAITQTSARSRQRGTIFGWDCEIIKNRGILSNIGILGWKMQSRMNDNDKMSCIRYDCMCGCVRVSNGVVKYVSFIILIDRWNMNTTGSLHQRWCIWNMNKEWIK